MLQDRRVTHQGTNCMASDDPYAEQISQLLVLARWSLVCLMVVGGYMNKELLIGLIGV